MFQAPIPPYRPQVPNESDFAVLNLNARSPSALQHTSNETIKVHLIAARHHEW